MMVGGVLSLLPVQIAIVAELRRCAAAGRRRGSGVYYWGMPVTVYITERPGYHIKCEVADW